MFDEGREARTSGSLKAFASSLLRLCFAFASSLLGVCFVFASLFFVFVLSSHRLCFAFTLSLFSLCFVFASSLLGTSTRFARSLRSLPHSPIWDPVWTLHRSQNASLHPTPNKSIKKQPQIDQKIIQIGSKMAPQSVPNKSKSLQNRSKIGFGTDLAPNIVFKPFRERF